jgi:TRAP-type C4-dicarboxylate transport system permease small subunit
MLPLHKRLSPLIAILTGVGAVLVLVECLWISYGVFVRYVLENPDHMVTEATALLLLPIAYAGMAYALQEDAFPKVTLLVDHLPPRVKAFIEKFNLLLMSLIGGFFAVIGGVATLRTYKSGAASQIISWPEYVFWAPVTLFTGVFALYGLLKLLHMLSWDSARRQQAE